MSLDPVEFYDGWAFEYDLIFADWWAFARASGDALAGRLKAAGVPAGARVLDTTCGIGTQALPLADNGFQVTGCDVSRLSIQRAEMEAAHRNLHVEFRVLDVRDLAESDLGSFEAVYSYGNSVPHLLTDNDLDQALLGMHQALTPGGLVVIAVRDYERLIAAPPSGTPGVWVNDQRGPRVYGQAWEWSSDRQRLTIHVFLLQQREGRWDTTMRSTTYRTLTRQDLTDALSRNGFVSIEWHEPDAADPNQPVVTARREHRSESSKP